MFTFGHDEVSDFIKSHATAVIATVDEKGQPSTSTIFYVMNKHNEIHFITKSQTTKFKNIAVNNKTALTIFDKEAPKAVNLEGVVMEVFNESDKDDILQEVTKLAHKKLNDYAPIIKLHKGAFRALKFIPQKAKLTDFTKSMGETEETTKNY